MAVNMAVKRARKAQRRKQVVAHKRRVETLEASLPARLLRAADAPIQHCLVTESLFETGMGALILARGTTPHRLAFGSFLLDVFCLGIKDVTFESLEGDEFARYVEASDAGSPLVSISPRRRPQAAARPCPWSQSIGFRRIATSPRWSASSATSARNESEAKLSVRQRRQAALHSRPFEKRHPHQAADRAAAEALGNDGSNSRRRRQGRLKLSKWGPDHQAFVSAREDAARLGTSDASFQGRRCCGHRGTLTDTDALHLEAFNEVLGAARSCVRPRALHPGASGLFKCLDQ